jgi:hypothetical protein
VEIDEVVPKVSKRYLPAMAAGFKHPKVKVIIGDGFEFLKNNTNSYDVIITDSSDPVGPAEALFGESFYQLMQKALLPGGIVCTQGMYEISCPFERDLGTSGLLQIFDLGTLVLLQIFDLGTLVLLQIFDLGTSGLLQIFDLGTLVLLQIFDLGTSLPTQISHL